MPMSMRPTLRTLSGLNNGGEWSQQAATLERAALLISKAYHSPPSWGLTQPLFALIRYAHYLETSPNE